MSQLALVSLIVAEGRSTLEELLDRQLAGRDRAGRRDRPVPGEQAHPAAVVGDDLVDPATEPVGR